MRQIFYRSSSLYVPPWVSVVFNCVCLFTYSYSGWSKTISAAVAHHPWLGPNGTPLSNVSDYAAQMSYINIMNYDVNGASANPGPNAPLGTSLPRTVPLRY